MLDERRIFVGQLDLPLNELGKRQAHAIREYCRRPPIEAVYCSDLARSRTTAEIVAAEHDVKIVDYRALREISLGEWQGHLMSEIASRYPVEFRKRGEDIEHYCPPGGESFAECRTRVLRALHQILDGSSGDVLIAAHAGVNRLILCYALGIPTANLFRIQQDYGCLNILEIGPAGYRVKLMNFVAELPREIPARTTQMEAVEVG